MESTSNGISSISAAVDGADVHLSPALKNGQTKQLDGIEVILLRDWLEHKIFVGYSLQLLMNPHLIHYVER